MNILLIDDEHEDIIIISRALEQNGFTVMVAENFDAAFTLIDNSNAGGRKIDLVIGDSCLPSGDGLVVYEYIAGKIPFILSSGNPGKLEDAKIKEPEIVTLLKEWDVESPKLLHLVKNMLSAKTPMQSQIVTSPQSNTGYSL